MPPAAEGSGAAVSVWDTRFPSLEELYTGLVLGTIVNAFSPAYWDGYSFQWWEDGIYRADDNEGGYCSIEFNAREYAAFFFSNDCQDPDVLGTPAIAARMKATFTELGPVPVIYTGPAANALAWVREASGVDMFTTAFWGHDDIAISLDSPHDALFRGCYLIAWCGKPRPEAFSDLRNLNGVNDRVTAFADHLLPYVPFPGTPKERLPDALSRAVRTLVAELAAAHGATRFDPLDKTFGALLELGVAME